MNISEHIDINPEVMSGKPVIRGTRIPVELILRKLGEGIAENDLLEAYPRLTREDIRAAMTQHQKKYAESELLTKINEGISDAVQRRYDELIAKRNERTLTDGEYSQLLQLTDQIELSDAKRLEYLTELARIRNTPLMLLMDELGIKPPPLHA